MRQNVSIPLCRILPTHTLTTFQYKSALFLYSHILKCKNFTMQEFALSTLLALILHLNFFKYFVFFKFNMLDKKAVLTIEKIKIVCLTKELF